MRWQIWRNGVTRSFDPNEQKPDACAARNHLRLIFNDVLGMGAQHLELGSVKWEGNDYLGLPFSTFKGFVAYRRDSKTHVQRRSDCR